jgi:pimeloyl-ACP methyl ester carboxylesterase
VETHVRSLFLTLCLTLLGSCAVAPPAGRGSQDPLVYDAAAVVRADKIAVLVPGAFASIGIFDAARFWQDRGYALVFYRMPGIDGLALDHSLSITGAAAEIVAFARRHPDKPLRLVGYSTGGPVVLTAAGMLAGRDLRVAAIAPAMPHGGGLPTVLRTAADIAAAALRVGSTQRARVWLEYYKTLLFGRTRDSATEARAAALAEGMRDSIITPDPKLAAAQTGTLRNWTLPAGPCCAPGSLRFYVGGEDPVFSPRQTLRLARRVGAEVLSYPGQGHLLFLTAPRVFKDILAHFEATD